MAEEQTDYSHAYDFIYRIDRRIGYLEKDAIYIEKQISLLEARKSKTFESLKEELTLMRETIAAIKKRFNTCAHGMSMLSKDLKDDLKKEDIENLNSQLSEMTFEEYVTRKDLLRGV